MTRQCAVLAVALLGCATPRLGADAPLPACEPPGPVLGVDVRDTTAGVAPLVYALPIGAARAFTPPQDSSELWSLSQTGPGWEYSIDRSDSPEPGIRSYGPTVRTRYLRQSWACRLERAELRQTLSAYTAPSSHAIRPYIATLRIEGALPQKYVHFVAYGPDTTVFTFARHLAFSMRKRSSER